MDLLQPSKAITVSQRPTPCDKTISLSHSSLYNISCFLCILRNNNLPILSSFPPCLHTMERDLSNKQSSRFSGCIASPSWLPSRRDYSRFHRLRDASSTKTQRWWNLLRRLVRQGKAMYIFSSKRQTFRYDIVSYSLNFDDGCRNQDSHPPTLASSLLRSWYSFESDLIWYCYLFCRLFICCFFWRVSNQTIGYEMSHSSASQELGMQRSQSKLHQAPTFGWAYFSQAWLSWAQARARL